MIYSSHTAVNHMATASAETVHAVADSLELGTETQYLEGRTTYTARLEDVDVIVFDSGHRRLTLEYQVTRVTSRSTKVFLVHLSMDNYQDMDGQDKAMRVTATYNENRNQVHAAQFDGYRYAAMGHALEVLETAVAAAQAPAATPEWAALPVVEYVDPETGQTRKALDVRDYADTTPTETQRRQAMDDFRRETARLREDQAREDRQSVDPWQVSADHLHAAAYARRDYVECMAEGREHIAQAAHHRYRSAMAAFWAGVAPETHAEVHHLKRAAEAGDADHAQHIYTELMTRR